MGLFQSGQFPYTDLQNLNIGWLLETVKTNAGKIEALEQELSGYISTAKEYTDKKIAETVSQFNAEIAKVRAENSAAILALTQYVNSEVDRVEALVDALEANTDAKIDAVNARTDALIEENNEYIFKTIGAQLGQLLVVNFFTGEQITVQNMFDLLASFHLVSAISYTQLAAKNINYTAFAALNITYIDLVNRGNILIPQN